MNSQQLKDLAKQAGFLTFAGPDIHVPEDPYGDGCSAVLAKFAELIVRECMQCCDKVDDDDYDDITPDVVTGMRDGALLCKIEIKQHFGVDE